MPLPFTALRVKSYPSFNALATGGTLLTTLDNGTQRFVPMFLHLEVLTLTGTVITTPSISMGSTSGGTDIMSTTLPSLGLLNSVTKIAALNILSIGSQSLDPNTTIYLNVALAATGPSVYTLRPDIIGYYV